ncbi:hypothetical protein Daura_20455 [Dactylosporangium aurantiacum]|uniref:Uncharacterized protein n=1 Tax=Dactylosporangium aurantiacum TaxID=35754 RepID=A0A9Q9ILG4_9ACTN|nr:hypothetical protein [Dactylosporangium aurantiacum]MDG6106160.1 hypothetical protein [Dactylosporangium aurantiacum]UWZ58337.1 hypothetical protein Daura_20455 [Dactylosporangium aurantiacum]
MTDALATGGDELRAACVAAMRRHRLVELFADRSYGCPAAVPVAWARRGDWDRAEFLAAHIGAAAQAYAGLAEVAAARGDARRFHRMLEAARDPARQHPFEWFTARDLAVLGRAAATLGRVGLARDLLQEAESALRRRADGRDTDRRAEALAKVAQAYAAIGDRHRAGVLVADAERQVDGLRSGEMRAYFLSLIAFASAEVRGADAAARSFPDARDPAYTARVFAAFARAAGPGAGRLLDEAAGRLPARHGAAVLHGADELRLREVLLSLTELAVAAARIGEPVRARRYLDRASAAVPLLGYADSRHRLHARLATGYELLGDRSAAAGLVAGITDPDARLAALTRMAGAVAEAGDHERAGALFDQACVLALGIERPRRQQDEPRLDLVVALAESGRPEAAERVLLAMSRRRLPFWELLALTEAVAETGRLDLAPQLLALAAGDRDLRARMRPTLAEAAGRLSLVDAAWLSDVDAPGDRARVLCGAAVGAARDGRFDAALALLTRAGEAPPPTGPQDPATRIAVLALQAGSPLVAGFCDLARRPAPLADAVRGDLDAAAAQAAAGAPPVADAVTALATVAAARGRADLVRFLLDAGTRAALGWPGAAPYATSGELSKLAVAAADLGEPDRADALLERLTAAHPDHRVPALAARAQAYARAGETARARAVLDESYASLWSREGGAGADRAVAACVRAGAAVDQQRCRAELARALATRPETPRFLAVVPLADPALTDLVVALFAGEDPPATQPAPGRA